MATRRATGTPDEHRRHRLVTSAACGWAFAGLLLLACSSSGSGSDAVGDADGTPPADVSADGVAPDLPSADVIEAADAASDPGASDTPDATDSAGGDATAQIGTFTVSLYAPEAATETREAKAGYTWIVGKVSDGPTPQLIAWDPHETEGDCTLSKPRAPYCESCPGTEVCVDEGVCMAYPTAEDVGMVTVTGVHPSTGEASFTMEALAGNYQPMGYELPFPAFDEGEAITFAAAGSAFAPAFTLEARGIAPLVLTSTAFVLTDGQPLSVQWTAAGAAATSTVHLRLEIAHHGGYKGRVDCDVPDTGTFQIPASLVDHLKALGVAGFPTLVVTRSDVDSATLDAGIVKLVISSEISVGVEIPGLVSCNEDADCPDGQTCQDNLTCK